MNLMIRKSMLSACLSIVSLTLLAQKADYQAAVKYDAAHLSKLVGTLLVIPQFINHSDVFWFGDNDSYGNHTFLVNPANKQKYQLLNNSKIIPQLAVLTGGPVDSAFFIRNPEFSDEPNSAWFIYKGARFNYNYVTGKLSKNNKPIITPVYPEWISGSISPDRKWTVVDKGNNLYLKNIKDTGNVITLSKDSEPDFVFSEALWHNNTSFSIVREDTRKVSTMSVINSLSWPRPRIETYKYELPGDKEVKQYQLFIGDTRSGKLIKVNVDRWLDQSIEVIPCDKKSDEIYFLRSRRTRDEIELCAVNMATGIVRVVIHEVCKPFINTDLFNVKITNGGNDILWWSDRSGWGHYYLYSKDGKLKNAVTQGNWTTGKIVATDTLRRTIWYYGYGREKGRNPNYAHLYSSSFDGNQTKLVTPEDASHEVFVSPSGKFLIDTYSQITITPRTILRNIDGDFILEVFKPDLTRLYASGWKVPEPFKIKAKDGITDLYGIMWKPYNFDPTKKYPVISQVYPGPFTETVWTDFTVFDRYNNTSLAQLGCIVICMGHRGSSPYRNAAYYKFGYGKLRDYALDDDKNGLEQLARIYSFIDINKVGITGHSGGGAMAVTALCTYPDFYKVGVASSGNHDNTIYNRAWGESYQGLTLQNDSVSDNPLDIKNQNNAIFKFDVARNQDLAKNLKGKLLLVAGEYDMNVNPANTYRMADALIRAGKDFDMLILPGQTHTYEDEYKDYYQEKQRHFFGRYLIENFHPDDGNDLIKK